MDFLEAPLLPAPHIHVSPLGHLKSSQVEYLLLLTFAIVQNYFFIENIALALSTSMLACCEFYFLHTLKFSSLLITPFLRLQSTSDTENFTDNYHLICRPLHIHMQISQLISSHIALCRIFQYLLIPLPFP